MIGISLDIPTVAALGGVNAAAFANGVLAPPGYHWEFVTEAATGQLVTEASTGQPAVALAGN